MKVIDASALVKYVIREEGWNRVYQILKNEPLVFSLPLALKEVANALWKQSRLKNKMTSEDAQALLRLVTLLFQGERRIIAVEPQEAYLEEAMKIALRHKITVYDSLYIAQAKKHGELITADRFQALVAQEEKVITYLV